MSDVNKETIADIVAEMRCPYYKMGRSNATLDKDMMGYMSFMANRIEAANKREIAELRECLKEAVIEKCTECHEINDYESDIGIEWQMCEGCQVKKWRAALAKAAGESE